MEGRARPELRDYDSECRTLGDVHGAQIRAPLIRARYSFFINLTLFVVLRNVSRRRLPSRVAHRPSPLRRVEEIRETHLRRDVQVPSPSVVFRTSWLSSVPSLYACL